MTADLSRHHLIKELTDTLSQLLDRDVQINATKSGEPTEIVVRYVDGSGDLVAAWTIERVLSWSLGAALTMVPRGKVDEAIKQGAADTQIEENFREVVNVLATAAANVVERRAVLETIAAEQPVLMRTVRQISAAGGRWTVLEVNVDGYPGGRMAVSFAPPPSDAE
ncbi:MAG: hypothetical protein ACOY0T_07065 [Myxococcota bacterium]